MLPSKQLLGSLYSMAITIEARDNYTGGHCWRVSRLSELLSEQLNLTTDDKLRIGLAGFLHDLGKISIPDAILNKRGPLTKEEFDVIKTHPMSGAKILKYHPLNHLVIDGVIAHHERPDGKGYPYGLTADKIPIVAKIIGVADAFDAMTSCRSYRAKMTITEARSIIKDNAGYQFDTEVVEGFFRLSSDEIEGIIHHSDDGMPMYDCHECGSIVVVHRTMQDGQLVCCFGCGREYVLIINHDQNYLKATGNITKPGSMPFELDHSLIKSLIDHSSSLFK